MEKMNFFNIVGDSMNLSEVVEGVHAFVSAKPQRRYKIIVGTDSAARSETNFVTAVTVWRVGNGGIHFWTRSKTTKCHDMRDRIYRETIHSITLAQELRGRLQERLGHEFFWDDQIHIDVGENGPTKDFIETVVGMVKGYGFDALIKPNSFGASVVADRHT
ncbi:MAG: ribonuclease H-like YkuK family protein [bacterium]|nr:ribonuclease H-like YkuK family protein [bacterium]